MVDLKNLFDRASFLKFTIFKFWSPDVLNDAFVLIVIKKGIHNFSNCKHDKDN